MALSLRENASLHALNTFRVEARARLLVEVDAPADLPEALERTAALPRRFVLGGGSNVLFTGDVDGAVLRLRTLGRRVLERAGPEAVVEAEAGEPWDGFVRWTLSEGLFGLENLSLIPGDVGASPIQNIGAYGVEMRERFAGLTAIDLGSGAAREFDAGDCRFGYRDSVFRHPEGRRWLIVRVRFRLSRDAGPRLDYGEIRHELAQRGVAAPTPHDVASAVRAIRARKLPDPARIGNAGSFFRNPLVGEAQAAALQQAHPGLPGWPAAGGVKLSAAWMIERCGWKGLRDGDAGVHAAHALVLVNHGAATGAQILGLARRIERSVRDRFGVTLEPEPVIVGAH